MATIKSFTSLEQSKKLAEILPIESADMYYLPYPNDEDWYDIPNFGEADLKINQLPCWSLAALLELIPDMIEDYVLRIDKVDNEYYIWYDKIGKGWSVAMAHPSSKNFIDAAFEAVVWLKENNKL